MEKEKILEAANKIVSSHGLRAEFLGDVFSVGVTGDDRLYAPVINIVGQFPGHDTLAEISSKITNTLNVSRVTFEIARK